MRARLSWVMFDSLSPYGDVWVRSQCGKGRLNRIVTLSARYLSVGCVPVVTWQAQPFTELV